MAREFFKDLPNTTTPLTASRLNGLLNGDEALGSIVVDDVNGKNLFDGVLESGNINDSGQETSSTNTIRSINKYEVIGGQTYICSYKTSENTYLNVVACYDASGTFIQRLTGMRRTAFTVPSNCKYIRLAFYNNNGLTVATFNSTVSNVQLEKGSTATEYVEYKQPVKKTSIGVKEDATFYANDFKCKNMLGFSNIRNGIYKIGDGTYDGSGTNACCTASKIEIDNTKNYVLSTANTQTTSYMYVMYYDANGTYLGYINTSFSTGFIKLNTYSNYSNAKYVNFRFDVPIANLINPQLEIGSEATSYTPYKNFENEEIYSENETIIGRWIDGKPLYRKVVTGAVGTISSDGTIVNTSINVGISNVDTIFIKNAYVNNGNNRLFPIPYFNDNGYWIKVYPLSGANYPNLRIGCNASTFSTNPVTVIVEYTKTTE